MPIKQPQEDKRRWTLAGALESRNMVEVVDGPGIRMSSADEHVVVVPLTRAERAESELQKALDLLERLLVPAAMLNEPLKLKRNAREILARNGRLTEGDVQ